jgi:hypothetical protein
MSGFPCRKAASDGIARPLPVAKDRRSGEVVTLTETGNEKLLAVAAFVAPAYTVFYHAAWEKLPRSRRLSLYAYSAVGWHDERFYVPAMRIDPDIRQDPPNFNQGEITRRPAYFKTLSA